MTQFLNTRILVALATIIFVGAVAVSATGAFFSDTESSTGNTFAAGELDLTVDNSSYGFDWNNPLATSSTGVWGPNAANSWTLRDLDTCGPNNDLPCLFFSFADLKPGDYGEDTISLHVQNSAYACMRFDLTETPDNGINGPEEEAGDVSDGPTGGELQDFLSFIFWNDDGDNVYELGETIIDDLTGLPGEAFTGEWLTIADSAGGIPLAAGTTTYIGKGWCFGTITPTPETPAANASGPTPGNTGFECSGADPVSGPAHNVAQTDGIEVDVEFYGVQSRNNGSFLCSSLPVDGEEPTPLTGGITLTKTVVGTTSIAAANFTLHVRNASTSADVAGSPQAGGANVNFLGLTPGLYYVTEDSTPSGFVTTFSGGCTASTTPLASNAFVVTAGATSTCTITNTDPGPIAQ